MKSITLMISKDNSKPIITELITNYVALSTHTVTRALHVRYCIFLFYVGISTNVFSKATKTGLCCDVIIIAEVGRGFLQVSDHLN